MRGNPDSATQQMLDLVLEVRNQYGRIGGAVEPVHRLTLGRWLLARGDTAVADSVLRWYEGFYAWDRSAWALSATMAIALLERARLHDRWGRPEEAGWFYREFLRRYDMPDESQRHLVEESQRALARLEGVEEIGNP